MLVVQAAGLVAEEPRRGLVEHAGGAGFEQVGALDVGGEDLQAVALDLLDDRLEVGRDGDRDVEDRSVVARTTFGL